MDTSFEPWASLGGGALIGLAVTLLMLMLGRIVGATGILAGNLRPAAPDERGWRLAVLAGNDAAADLLARYAAGQ